MYTVSFIIYITVQLTLLCVLFDFYWIHIKICGESVPLRPDRTEIIYKSPEGLTKSVRFSGLFFLPGRYVQNGCTKQQVRRWANGKKKCSLCPRTSRVNQNWFTLLDQNRKSESNLTHSHTAPKRALYGADVRHRTRIPAARENRRLGRFRGCVAARAVQLNTGEQNLLHTKLRYYEILEVYQTRKDDTSSKPESGKELQPSCYLQLVLTAFCPICLPEKSWNTLTRYLYQRISTMKRIAHRRRACWSFPILKMTLMTPMTLILT